MKRYLPEVERPAVERFVAAADQVFCCRIGFTEIYRAVLIGASADAQVSLSAIERDWAGAFVVEVNDVIARRAAEIAVDLAVRTLDALHLAAAESIGDEQLRLASYDLRLRRGATALGIALLPD